MVIEFSPKEFKISGENMKRQWLLSKRWIFLSETDNDKLHQITYCIINP
jgi:hypothetical protein